MQPQSQRRLSDAAPQECPKFGHPSPRGNNGPTSSVSGTANPDEISVLLEVVKDAKAEFSISAYQIEFSGRAVCPQIAYLKLTVLVFRAYPCIYFDSHVFVLRSGERKG